MCLCCSYVLPRCKSVCAWRVRVCCELTVESTCVLRCSQCVGYTLRGSSAHGTHTSRWPAMNEGARHWLVSQQLSLLPTHIRCMQTQSVHPPYTPAPMCAATAQRLTFICRLPHQAHLNPNSITRVPLAATLTTSLTHAHTTTTGRLALLCYLVASQDSDLQCCSVGWCQCCDVTL